MFFPIITPFRERRGIHPISRSQRPLFGAGLATVGRFVRPNESDGRGLAQRPQPIVGVECFAVGGLDSAEQVPGPGNIARPLVQVSQGVPLA